MKLDDRMKSYENVNRQYLSRRLPVIIRIDGKSFHTFTKGLVKPWDHHLKVCMLYAAEKLCEEISGAKMAYWQSDEISILVTDYDTLDTDPWFFNFVQKIVSVSLSIATAYFNDMHDKILKSHKDYKRLALFDSRAFILPPNDVCNYFVWRQRDATKNSINMLAQSQFDHKTIHGLSTSKLQDKLFVEKGINWNDIETWKKRGACIINRHGTWGVDDEIPIFSKDRNYINRFVYLDGDKTFS
jgi:tRNA(His) 5'-end guanylyltransferase